MNGGPRRWIQGRSLRCKISLIWINSSPARDHDWRWVSSRSTYQAPDDLPLLAVVATRGVELLGRMECRLTAAFGTKEQEFVTCKQVSFPRPCLNVRAWQAIAKLPLRCPTATHAASSGFPLPSSQSKSTTICDGCNVQCASTS